jgi:aspartate carbamoyltransferase regulatory subunit
MKITLVRRLDYVEIEHIEMGCENADWIEVTRWRALVNTVRNIGIHKKGDGFLDQLTDSRILK